MHNYSDITPYIQTLAERADNGNHISPEMYPEHHVSCGLRDVNGNGVVTGLTEISSIKAKEITPDGTAMPCEGVLRYRGYDVRDIVNGFSASEHFGFEETLYLLLFSELPTADELADFREMLAEYRTLPTSFVRDMILKAPGRDMMNII